MVAKKTRPADENEMDTQSKRGQTQQWELDDNPRNCLVWSVHLFVGYKLSEPKAVVV